jgi:hypothetical protein
MYSTIKLKNGEAAIVDDADYDGLAGMKWHLKGRYPASKHEGQHLYMHQWIVGKAPAGMVTDHINGDRFDNRRSNLRFVTQSENIRNKPPKHNFRGVRPHNCGRGYVAQIRHDNTTKYIGYFMSEKDAARAYNKKAVELLGDTAYLNEV